MRKKLLILSLLCAFLLCSCGTSDDTLVGGPGSEHLSFVATIKEKSNFKMTVVCDQECEDIAKGTIISVDTSKMCFPDNSATASTTSAIELNPDNLKIGDKIEIYYPSGEYHDGEHPSCQAFSIYPAK